MKKTMKAFASSFLAILVLGVLATSSRAVNLDEAWMKQLDAIGVAEQVSSNASKCMNIGYVGSVSTGAIFTITATAITGYDPDAATLKTDFGTASGAYALSAAAYDTAGELCDVIDALSAYTCKLTGCKRDDNTTLLRDQTKTVGTNDAIAVGGFDVLLDTGSTISAYTDVYVERIGITPTTGRRVVLKSVTANVNVIGTLKIYGQLRKYANNWDGVTRNDTTQVWSEATADDTDLTRNFALSGFGGLEFAKDQHVVISGGNGTGVQAAANYLFAIWDER